MSIIMDWMDDNWFYICMDKKTILIIKWWLNLFSYVMEL